MKSKEVERKTIPSLFQFSLHCAQLHNKSLCFLAVTMTPTSAMESLNFKLPLKPGSLRNRYVLYADAIKEANFNFEAHKMYAS